MNIWQLQEAKAKLTEFVNKAKKEPQIISRHGVPEVVTIDVNLYKKLTGTHKDVVSFFQNSPLYGLDIEFERDKTPPRDLEL